MPDISKTSQLLQGFNCIADSGYLKQEDGEYSHLQNIRGWMGKGAKRRGVRPIKNFTTGIMGMFDPYIDGEGNSLNKIIIVTQNGSLWLMDPTELTTTMDFLHGTASKFYMQSPDLSWWDCGPTSAGLLTPAGITYAGASISADLTIAATQSYGFSFTGKTYRWWVGTDGAISLREYVAVSGLTEYTTTRAFATGYGLIFTSDDLTQRKLTIDNAGAFNIIEL